MSTFNCIWCEAPLESSALVCPKCQGSQLVTVALARNGGCQCQPPSGKMLLATAYDIRGKLQSYCVSCIKVSVAKRLAAFLLSQVPLSITNEESRREVLSLVNGNGFANRNTVVDGPRLEGLQSTIGMIHRWRENKTNEFLKE